MMPREATMVTDVAATLVTLRTGEKNYSAKVWGHQNKQSYFGRPKGLRPVMYASIPQPGGVDGVA